MEKRLLGRQEGRTDDNMETIRKRFKVWGQHPQRLAWPASVHAGLSAFLCNHCRLHMCRVEGESQECTIDAVQVFMTQQE